MEISIKVLDKNNEIYGERICNTAAHPTMMWIKTFVRQVVIDPENKVRIDINSEIGDSHMEIINSEKWLLTYTEEEVFCIERGLEFDTRGELFDFIGDILKNLKETEDARKVWT